MFWGHVTLSVLSFPTAGPRQCLQPAPPAQHSAGTLSPMQCICVHHIRTDMMQLCEAFSCQCEFLQLSSSVKQGEINEISCGEVLTQTCRKIPYRTRRCVCLCPSQAVVVQQDSYIEDQRQALTERSSSCASLSRQSSRPSSLIEQEKQRSLEKQRQELASLQRQQAAGRKQDGVKPEGFYRLN